MDLRRLEIVAIARAARGRGPDVCASAAPGYDLTKAHWCQVFWLWCLREAGLTDRLWPSAPEWPRAWLPRTEDPQPGDMAYRDQPFQHGAVYAETRDGLIVTIDGNSQGGVVVEHALPRSRWDRFYSIAPLLGVQTVVTPPSAVALQRALTAAGYPCGAIDGKIGPRTRAALEAWALAHHERIVP